MNKINGSAKIKVSAKNPTTAHTLDRSLKLSKSTMKILIAPDKFKGSLSAVEVCRAIKEGVLNFNPKAEVIEFPLADGGEGTLEALESVKKFERINKNVTGPGFETVNAYYGLEGKTAYIEMALASGLMLLDEKSRKPSLTTTLGTGELIEDALEKGARKIYLFIGGSATNDAGIGMAHALGYRFLDKNGNVLKPIGKSLCKIASVTGKPNEKIESTEFILASDVKNPLYGANGAAKVFAKQKGADEQEVEMLDIGLKNFANVMEKKFQKSISHSLGAGAAGGLGAGAMLFLGAKQSSGVETIMELLNFGKYIKNSDFVISGEGKFDKQTLEGKVVKGVIDKCSEYDQPMGIVCGVSELEIKDIGKSPVKINTRVINGKVDMETAFSEAYNLVSQRAEELMRKIFIKP